MTSFVVVMPAFNEADGISEFLGEVVASFPGQSVRVIVVDDASRDETFDLVRGLTATGLPVEVVTNDMNLGHGRSTRRALLAGLNAGGDVIVAVDGDGQFRGEDIASVARIVAEGRAQVAEGVRVGRDDPTYRKAVSAGTRWLVWRAAGTSPRDANTPLRAYRPDVLRELLSMIPEDALTPNLAISTLVRRHEMVLVEIEVESLVRRGKTAVGSTWGASRQLFPNRRFIRFCRDSIRQWRKFRRQLA